MAEQAEQPAATSAAEAPSEAERAIAADIERTRAELGQTVEELAAKAHVGARARHAAADLQARLRHTTAQAAGQLKGRAAARGEQARAQLGQTGTVLPDQVRSTVRTTAAQARRHWPQLAAAAAVLLVAAVAVRKLRR
ncbi:MAG TPA: DUF3618 domain-containing protein [Streptosporangiaceae bacterium]|jgi:hypothetical protein|nr:DUF3618 domain-containing protein [Streptosporangiaceae bacterium]